MTHKAHIGRCTEAEDLPLYERSEAEAVLAERGFVQDMATAEFANADTGERGLLSWVPNYCDLDDRRGTAFALRRPGGNDAGFIEVLGSWR